MKLYRMTNLAASPFRFDMDPGEIVKVDGEAGDNDWELLAIYHSHTKSEAYPSDTDVRIAGGTARLWPDVRYVLVSLMDEADPNGAVLQHYRRRCHRGTVGDRLSRPRRLYRSAELACRHGR